ncbi:pentatricopeptide repeat-containing protein At1g59720, chloroplastic/mitochondrial, partial [Bidens hawaiensis]|uniref:pentatricopeptide repeat-containing protein At1g59720, chloroplastic/mitochondrial n=1 Tax=Bidens hawaiensis TaxID=980011 RepID=UPI004049F478
IAKGVCSRNSVLDLHYALRFFHAHIHNPNSFAWNTIIRACARSTHHKQLAIQLYQNMMLVSSSTDAPDYHSFPFVLKACAYFFAFSEGKQLHVHLLKLGFASDVYINNSLIHFYASCGSLEHARQVFDEMPQRSVVSWNVMINALVHLDEFDDALMCFHEMQQRIFKADVLRACAGLGALSLGMWAHAYVLRNKMADDDVLVNIYLLEMYCKCGSLDDARFVFERMVRRDVTSWNAMIHGFAMHGQAVAALKYLRRMVDEAKVTPNSITFSGVLSACRHSGMVNEGRNYFKVMTTRYGIEPVLEHYGCLVDLLARAGLIGEALDAVSSMPMKPDVVIWRSILDACSKRSISMGVEEAMAKSIMESEEGSGAYMLFLRVYAVARKWDEVGAVRKLMVDKGVAKEPGCNTIEIDGVTHDWGCGDVSLSQILNT